MRWLVEVSSLGKTDTQKFCVEAESWQRALQAARSQRGEDGPMSGFSIELLEEGYRAVDPLARVRFVVKKAPDDMPITAVPSKEAARGGVAPAAPNPPSSASAVKAPSIAPPAPAKAAAVPTPAMSSVPSSGSSDATTPNLPPSPTSSSQSVSGKKAPPRPGHSQPPPAGSASGLLTATVDPKKKHNETMVFASAGDANVVERPAERAAAPAIGSPVPGLPTVKLLTSREQNPNDASPLTYREYAFAVADGTSEDSAADVLRAQLRYVEAHIATAKTGKLVNLAVFDVEFTGRPPRAPLATLTWKDWKGEPVIGFPRRGGSQSKPPRPPSQMPASMAAAAGVSIPQAAPVPQNLQPVAAPAPAPPVVAAPVAHSTTQPVSHQDAQLAQQAAAAQIAQQQQAQVHAQQQAQAQQQQMAQQQTQAQPAFPMPATSQAAAGHPFQQPAPMFQPPQGPPPAAHPFVPVAPSPEPAFLEATQAPRKQPSQPDGGMVKTPSGRYVRGRVSGDELITSLFESMHDLHFLRDALDGGQFCLALATEVLPARAGIIHFFDIEKREWVVACTRGKDMGRLLTMRAPEADEILREAARKRRALVVPDAGHVTSERYRQLSGARSLIAAPIMQAGRALGALEIINPLDGMPFTEDEGNAMTYIAEQFAEYLGSRGIVLDRERIHSAAAAR
jgi:GAF domain-containing protein